MPAAPATRRAKGVAPSLVAAAKAGDRRAFDRLVIEVRPRAMAAALKVLRNPDDAEDAVQDAFLKVWRNLSRFEGRSSFTTWIHRIVVNTALDLLRRHAARPEDALEADERGRQAVEPVTDHTPEEALEEAQTSALVRSALAVLSPAHRQALTLREFEERSYDEIAVVAACPVGTVMSRLHHARRRLADELRPSMARETGEYPALQAA